MMQTQTPDREFQFLFRPTIRCNLRCRYCYAASLRESNEQTMSISEAYEAIDWMIAFCRQFDVRRVAILWHGGEPLLPGADFMESVLDYAEKAFRKGGIALFNQIQTNLLLVTRRHVDLFKRYFNGRIGFSWDYGSSMRVYSDGTNAAEEVWQKALWCREQGVLVGAICQITSENWKCPVELYRHFSVARVPFRLTPLFPGSMEAVLRSAEMAKAVADAWFEDPRPTVEIANFSEIVEGLLTKKMYKCCAEPNCGRVLMVLSPGGRIYACSRDNGEKDVIGDFRNDDPEIVYRKRLAFTEVKLDEACAKCAYLPICNGGCPFHTRTGWHDCECAYNKALFSHLEGWLRKTGYDV